VRSDGGEGGEGGKEGGERWRRERRVVGRDEGEGVGRERVRTQGRKE
jgi:hypothetical protein